MKTIFRLLLAAALAVGALVASAATASADGTQCTGYYDSSQVQVCGWVQSGQAGASLTAYSGGFYNWDLWIEQCRTDGTNCIRFSETTTSTSLSGTCSFGHIYRAHATWYDGISSNYHTNATTAWVAC